MAGLTGFTVHDPNVDREVVARRMSAQIAHRGSVTAEHFDGALALIARTHHGEAFLQVPGEAVLALDGRVDMPLSRLCERLLAKGPDAIRELHGVFALAFYDIRERRLVLARDPFGVRPLFYAAAGQALIFGSEVKAVLAHPACPHEIAWDAIPILFGQGVVGRRGVASFIRGVELLPGGHTFVKEADGRQRSMAYFDIGAFIRERADDSRSDEELCEQYGSLLERAVHRSVAPFREPAVFSSGGLDSATLTAFVVRKMSRPVKTFHFVEETPAGIEDSRRAAELARDLGASFHSIVMGKTMVEQLGFDLDTLEHYVWLADVPHFSPDQLFRYELHRFARARFPEVDAVVLGHGADEFDGGYSAASRWNHYLKQQFALNHGWPGPMAGLLSDAFVRRPEASFDECMRQRIHWLQEYNLWQDDRAGNWAGTESVIPFLDPELVEFLVRIPPSRHEALFENKRILRVAARKYVPASILERTKPDPLSSDRTWINALEIEIYQRVFSAFREKYLSSTVDPIFEPKAIELLYKRLLAGRSVTSLMAFSRALHLIIFAGVVGAIGRGEPPPSAPPASPLQAREP